MFDVATTIRALVVNAELNTADPTVELLETHPKLILNPFVIILKPLAEVLEEPTFNVFDEKYPALLLTAELLTVVLTVELPRNNTTDESDELEIVFPIYSRVEFTVKVLLRLIPADERIILDVELLL